MVSQASFHWYSSPPTTYLSKMTTDHLHDAMSLMLGILFVTFLLELCSLDTVKKLLKQPGAGRSLYVAGILANLRNHLVLGVPIYILAAGLFCRCDDELYFFDSLLCILTLLIVHSVIFYVAHRSFHASPALYQHHRFHHRFNIHVTPMAAHAVSVVEYIVAYALPFTVPMPFIKTDIFSLRLSITIVVFANLLIHTPRLEEWSRINLPPWWVTTHDHLEHHRKLNTRYAASTFNVDYFVKNLVGDGSNDAKEID